MNSTQCCLTISQNSDYEGSVRDEELLLALKGGSHAAFAELQNVHARRLYHRILSITKNREDAEDALQDTFLRAYVSLHSFEGRSKLSTWLTRIAINSALMMLRRRRIRPETSFECQCGSEEDISPFDVPDKGACPEQLCDQRQRLRTMLCAIHQLDPKLRTTIQIAAFQELSMREIAQHLGVSPASVKSRLHRARKNLRRSPAVRNLKKNYVSLAAEGLGVSHKSRESPCLDCD
jgi:RNA polymerase sigma-70 factor, ECF subfamily